MCVCACVYRQALSFLGPGKGHLTGQFCLPNARVFVYMVWFMGLTAIRTGADLRDLHGGAFPCFSYTINNVVLPCSLLHHV